MARIVVVGDVSLDRQLSRTAVRDAAHLCPTERPGGAGLAASVAALAGHEVTLISCIGDDPAGARLSLLLAGRGVDVVRLPSRGKTRTRTTDDHCDVIRDGDISPRGHRASTAVLEVLASADAALVSCHGGGVSSWVAVRNALMGVSAPLVWDPNPEGSQPIPNVTLVTPDVAQAIDLVGTAVDAGPPDLSLVAAQLVRLWSCGGVAVRRASGEVHLATAGRRSLSLPVDADNPAAEDGMRHAFAVNAAAALATTPDSLAAIRFAASATQALVAAGGANSLTPLRRLAMAGSAER